MSDIPVLLTNHELAKMLRFSDKNGWQTVQAWARAGKLKPIAIRIGNQWRYPLPKVLVWIEKGGMAR